MSFLQGLVTSGFEYLRNVSVCPQVSPLSQILFPFWMMEHSLSMESCLSVHLSSSQGLGSAPSPWAASHGDLRSMSVCPLTVSVPGQVLTARWCCVSLRGLAASWWRLCILCVTDLLSGDALFPVLPVVGTGLHRGAVGLWFSRGRPQVAEASRWRCTQGVVLPAPPGQGVPVVMGAAA